MAGLLRSVFVYGTLQRGQPNHHLLTTTDNGHARLVGTARTCEKWPLVVAGRYNIPYLLDCTGRGQFVVGEVYEVDPVMLAALDKLEMTPTHYQRDSIRVRIESEQTKPSEDLICEVYFLRNFKQELLSLTMWEKYQDFITEHGAVYVPAKDRPPMHRYSHISEVLLSYNPPDS